jgi:hypothetical protein
MSSREKADRRSYVDFLHGNNGVRASKLTEQQPGQKASWHVSFDFTWLLRGGSNLQLLLRASLQLRRSFRHTLTSRHL